MLTVVVTQLATVLHWHWAALGRASARSSMDHEERAGLQDVDYTVVIDLGWQRVTARAGPGCRLLRQCVA